MTRATPPEHNRSDSQLVLAVQGQDQAAFAELFDRWFDRVFDVARNITRDDDSAAEVAQDVFLVIWQQVSSLDNPDAFGGWALRIARNRALNRLKKENRSQPMEAEVMTGIHDRQERDDLLGSNRPTDTAAISEIRDRQDLLWSVTSVLGERDASLLDLTLRHQLSTAEIAHELGIEVNNAHQLLFRLRNKLGDAVANFLVWREGKPRCPELQTLVSDLDFDATTNRKVNKHTKNCEICSTERAAVVDPQKLFGAIPIAIAPLALRTKTAAALSAAGVPVQTTASPGHPPTESPTADTSGTPTTSETRTALEAGTNGIQKQSKTQQSSRRRRLRQTLAFAAATIAAFAALSLFRDRTLEEVETVAIGTSAPETSTTNQSSTTTLAPTTIQPTISKPEAEATTSTGPTTTVETTTSATSASTTPAPPEPPPIIERFSIGDPLGIVLTCIEPGQVGRRAVWLVKETTSVQITTATETFTNEPDSSQLLCLAPGDEVRLEATGPGGTISATATA